MTDPVKLTEADIQLLATLRKAELEQHSSDRASLEESGDRYRNFLENWTGAFVSLVEKDLVHGDERAYHLTEAGRALGDSYHRERPDHYWYYYQKFYTAAHASAAHSRHCERVYGQDLCQEGQMDMAALGDMLEALDLKPGEKVLDLGCGAGVISEYISDRTGAKVTGVDYAAPAIAAATARTGAKLSRLEFLQADLNMLDLPAESFDAAIMIDSIYWAADYVETLSSIARSIRPGGQLAIIILQTLEEGDAPELLESENTLVAIALKELALGYSVVDQTVPFREFWPRIKESVVSLRGEFEAEGNGFICDSLEREADEEFLPAIAANEIRLYHYHVNL